jgi:hypothetical protein
MYPERCESSIGYVGAAVYAVQRLEEALSILLAAVPQPAHEVAGLVLEADVDQGVKRQRRVP